MLIFSMLKQKLLIFSFPELGKHAKNQIKNLILPCLDFFDTS